ncbi:unnamed protein product [Schistosoma spindalis]|nr:unnamed protein product [Schistosoma spindale]
MKKIVCQFPSIQFHEEIYNELVKNSNTVMQSKQPEAPHTVVIQVPTINDLNIKSGDISPRSNNLNNTPRSFEFYCQRFNTPCSENIFVKHPTMSVEKLIKTEQKQQQQQRNLFPHRSIAEIGIALGLWRKIDKMHQQIDDVKKSREKHNHVRQLRLLHTQKYWENIAKRGKRIAQLQKQRSYEKMQFNKRKSDQIKVQNELNEKLKINREKHKSLENYQKQLKINKKLSENYLNYQQKLLDHEILIQEKYQYLINLHNRTNQIRSRINKAIETKKQHQNELASEIHWNRVCEKFTIESNIHQRKLNEFKLTSEHVKQLRNQKLVKIPISMTLTNLTLDN